jgi:hypothetical protein
MADDGKTLKPKGKPRGGNSPIIKDAQSSLTNPNNSRYIAFIAELNSWPTVNNKDIPAMEQRLAEYLELCQKYGIKVGNQSCYFALNIDKDDVYNWTHGLSRSAEFGDFIKKVQKICAMYRENLMQDGQINPVTGIFWQKNYDGLKDQQEVVLTPNNPLGNQTDPEELKRKYIEATIPGDFDSDS